MTTGDSLMDVDIIASISFLPPALHRYWTACQSADELSQLPSWHFMLCHSCKPEVQDVTAEPRGDPMKM